MPTLTQTALVLDSPLPTFIPIDEDEPANFNEALNILFENCEKDSSNNELYVNLKERFQDYFTSITGKIFFSQYLEKGMPNSQVFLFLNRSHGVGGKDFQEMTQKFIDNPYQKIESNNKYIIEYLK